MTPTEQDKELRESLHNVIVAQLGVSYSERLLTAMMQLIAADRKRVELEARRNEALIADRNLGQYPDYHKMKTASLKRIDDIERGLFISVHDLKAQQETKQ